MSGSAGRYQRSFSGLIGALLVSLLVIAGFVAFRAINRDDLDVRPDPIDLREAVVLGEEAGLHPVRPEPLPGGWEAISFDAVPKQFKGGPAWGLGLHTDTGDFAGIRLERSSVDTLLDRYVDEDAQQGGVVAIESAVGGEWTEWTDRGGDTAYATEHRGQTLLVWGSAPADRLRDLVGDLTDAPVTPRQ